MTAQRIILVTGASRGIGRAAALALAEAGCFVIGTARSLESFENLDALMPRSWLTTCAMQDGAAVDRLCDEIRARYGRLDGLFGNAGVLGAQQPLGQLMPAEFEDALAINLTANMRLLHGLDPLLRASPAGRALFVTSGVAWKRHAGWAPYAVTKAALEALVGVYASEVADTPVRANCISPGPIRTGMRTAAWPGEDPATVPPPEAVTPHIVHMLSPLCNDNGAIYDFRAGRMVRGLPPG